MSFLDELQKDNNSARTENGAVTNRSSLNNNLDFFALAGAMRNNIPGAVKLFEKAFHTDPLVAVRTLFYLRDIRGGQGERDIFRECYRKLTDLNPELASKLLFYIPEYGRWDEVLQVVTHNNADAVRLIAIQLAKDEANMAKGESVSLLAKWLPSENASSKKTASLAKFLMKGLGLKPSQYRRKVVALRKHIKLLEQQMSAKEWPEIDYSKLPSQAHRKHTKAFKRNDEERYTAFLAKAEKGEVKLNAGTLFTYEVFDAVQAGNDQAANAMWNNLPDFTNGNDALVVADVSGSMMGRPMSVSVSLALYYAEHNKGAFHNKFMTFSANPQLVDVVGDTLTNKLRMIENAHWDMNTNLEAVFATILNAAVRSGANGDDMPKVLYIISDMEFDRCVVADESVFERAKAAFGVHKLNLPHVVFWNVDARQEQAPATKFDNNVTLISGLSQSTFQYAVGGKNPEEMMLEIVNSERYEPITI